MDHIAIFTIVAKNYLPLAYAQAETLKTYHPEIGYTILLADDGEDLDIDAQPYPIVTLDVLNISDINDMAFKYNLTEFCTAVKPYYINYLFKKGNKKVIYLDPDVCVFSSLVPIVNELDKASIVLTPHIITPEINYTGTITESLLLHVGVFNCGFIAVANTAAGEHFIKWWTNRLTDKAFQDKIESLHTDQKWVDLTPAFYPGEVQISADMGRNMAFWNLHERRLIYNVDGHHIVENRFNDEKYRLMLFHFAGYDIENAGTVIHKNHSEYNLEDFPELKPLFQWYKTVLIKNGFYEYIKLPYKFNRFLNGKAIAAFHRRFYRRLTEDGQRFGNPFSYGENSFYRHLQKNHLLSSSQNDGLRSKDIESFSGKIKSLNRLMRLTRKLIGFDRYALLLKFCIRYFRPENQVFLFKEYSTSYQFKNENQKARNT